MKLCIYYIYVYILLSILFFFFFKQKTAYEMRISDWSSDVCSSDLLCSQLHTTCVPNRKKSIVFVMSKVKTKTSFRQPKNTPLLKHEIGILEIGRASCRERECQYV